MLLNKTKDIETFKQILEIIEKRSSCARLQVGCLLIKNGRIISTGWNGVPSKTLAGNSNGIIHCSEYFKDRLTEDDFTIKHTDYSAKFEIHAEQNAIAIAAKEGISTKDSVLFTSYCPCSYCAKLIVTVGIKEVYYVEDYDRNDYGKELLTRCGVELIKI